MVYDPKNSNIELFYEDGVYTVSINLAEDGFIVTDGRTFDELMKNMQDAFECHFYEAGEVTVDLKVPFLQFSYSKPAHASHL